ncbi:MAG TPA: hypothetical protein VII06_13120 [Chloroflexota bacterium]
MKRIALLGLMIAALAAGACSPEASSTRGGGSGADVGNRWQPGGVDLHGRQNPFYGTPPLAPATRT